MKVYTEYEGLHCTHCGRELVRGETRDGYEMSTGHQVVWAEYRCPKRRFYSLVSLHSRKAQHEYPIDP